MDALERAVERIDRDNKYKCRKIKKNGRRCGNPIFVGHMGDGSVVHAKCRKCHERFFMPDGIENGTAWKKLEKDGKYEVCPICSTPILRAAFTRGTRIELECVSRSCRHRFPIVYI